MKYSIGYRFKLISEKLRAQADAELKSFGLTMAHARILGFIQSKGGSVTQKEIEDFLHVAHPTVVGLITRMEQNGFLTTKTDSGDRRNKIVSMTMLAKDAGKAIEKTTEANEAKLMSGLSEEERTELIRMLDIIYEGMEQKPENTDN